jgi:hypothetical protein
MATANKIDPNEALNEYFGLKQKFEKELSNFKKKIIGNNGLSKKEKRDQYLKFKPKCVNCKKPSKKGTIFSVEYRKNEDEVAGHRIYKCICGNLTDPCNLNIEISMGEYEPFDKSLQFVRNEITENKNNIIDDKNKLLFGLITSEQAIKNFDFHKNNISEYTNLYEALLDNYNKIVDNIDKKIELDDSTVIMYENIDKIKECITKMRQTNDEKFASDAAEIYVTVLYPLLVKIRNLKYNVNDVVFDEYYNIYRLIQEKNNIKNLLIPADDSVIHFDVGIAKKKAKPIQIIVEDESSQRGGRKLYDEDEETNDEDEETNDEDEETNDEDEETNDEDNTDYYE